VYAGALQRDPEERDEYLNRACAGDADFRAKVVAFLDPDDPSSATKFVFRPEGIEGKVIGQYILRRELGHGGMGVVYLADDTQLSRRVALKALASDVVRDPERRARLRLEARAAAALSHPGIATVYALEDIDGALYLACEYVPGEPLRAVLAAGPLPLHHVVSIGAQMARALAAAHSAGVIHRDIKPENVVKTPSGAVKILDFGLARMDTASDPRLTQTGVIVGTPAYMAPEQVLGQEVDFRTDQFALGVLVYELASGVNPFVTNSVRATLARIVEEEAPPVSSVRQGVLPALDRIVATCLAKNMAERYETTNDLVTDFEQLEAEIALQRQRSSHRSGPLPAAASPSSGARWWWQAHQVIVSAIYIVTIYPTWYAQRWISRPWGIILLLVVLAAAAAGATVRLNLPFLARHAPRELPVQLTRARRLTLLCESAFAIAQLTAAAVVATEHPEFAMMLVAAATALLVAALVIEPNTVRAAFGSEEPSKSGVSS
jgi:serine/threonine protein kinase